MNKTLLVRARSKQSFSKLSKVFLIFGLKLSQESHTSYDKLALRARKVTWLCHKV